MREAQEFYRSKMVEYGYGEKTFKLNPKPQEVQGNLWAEDYEGEAGFGILKNETHWIEKRHGDNKIIVVFVAGAQRVGNAWGWGKVFRLWGQQGHGGIAYIAEKADEDRDARGNLTLVNLPKNREFEPKREIVALIHHEMNHAFGIEHIDPDRKAFQEAKYRWLDKHLAFNDVPLPRGISPEARKIDTEGVLNDNGRVLVKIVKATISVNSAHDLNQVIVWKKFRRRVGEDDFVYREIVGWSEEIPKRTRNVVVNIKLWKVDDLEPIDEDDLTLTVTVMDIKGNRRVDTLPFEIPEFPKEEPEEEPDDEPDLNVEVRGKQALTWAGLKGAVR